jgi:hypothetical protein
MDKARERCFSYLQVTAYLPPRNRAHDFHRVLGDTAGMLIILKEYLQERCKTGMIMEGIELLARLVRL